MLPLENEQDYEKEYNQNQEFVRNLVLHSYEDINKGNGRECKEAFSDIRKSLKERYNKDEL